MQLLLSFHTLLTSLILAISLFDSANVNVNAAPYDAAAGIKTLPLKRITGSSDGVHPQVLLQQHINRGHARLARMTGRDAPAQADMHNALRKRMYLPASGPGSRVSSNSKSQMTTAQLEQLKQNAGKNRQNAINAAKAKANGNGGGGGNTAAQDVSGNGTSTTASDAASNVNAAGFSEVDLAAEVNGGLTAATTPTDSDSLGLDIEANDVGYVATVQIGTPPQDFKILMDSGSADFWVGAENCQSSGDGGAGAGAGAGGSGNSNVKRKVRGGNGNGNGASSSTAAAATGNTCGNHTFLGSQSSSTFVDTNKPFEVTYGSGEVQGDIITDNVHIAGLALNQHTFGVATTESVQFSSDSTAFDGLMGVALSSLSQQGVSTPVQSLADSGAIKEAIISFKLGRVADGTNDGEVTFGGIDASKIDAATQTTFANVNTQGFWEGAVGSFSVNGQDLGLKGRTAILDTGTTLIIAPPSDAAAVHAAIPGSKADGQGGFTIPCTASNVLSLSFGSGQTFAIDPRDLLFAPVDANDLTGDCVSGVSSGEVGGAEEWLVGDVFLKNVYFSTDVGKNAITLAGLA